MIACSKHVFTNKVSLSNHVIRTHHISINYIPCVLTLACYLCFSYPYYIWYYFYLD